MKVLMLNYEYPPIGGGTGQANKNIINELKKQDNIDVDLVTSSKSGYSEESFGNADIYRLNVGKDERHNWKKLELARYMWKGFRKARELDSENDYDLIHAWSGIPCGVMTKFLDKPYIIGLRGSDVPGYDPEMSTEYFLLSPIIKNAWSNAEELIPNSKGLKMLAKKTMGADMPVIPNGVDTEEFKPRDSENKDLQVLTVARLTERKRIQDLIKAIEGIEGTNLKIVGEGEKESKLRQKTRELGLEDKIDFKGYVPHEKLPQVYGEADVFVLPSLNEGMSNAVLEAMSSGLPIITTKTGGTEELLNGNGEIIPKKSPEKIKKKIKEYKENPELKETHGKKSRKLAEEMSWNEVAELYVKKYKEVIEANN